jgi:nicotinamidase-related amidase
MPVDRRRAPLADSSAAHATALLVVDMISTWDFPDAEKIAPRAAAIAARIARLKERCAGAGIPTVYVNDNHDRWRSEFRAIAQLAATASTSGAMIAQSLSPGDHDYAVLKPKHSAFFATPLDLLLRHLRVRRLLVTGVTTDLCILMTAAEARIRDYEVIVPSDGVAAISDARNRQGLELLREVHQIRTTPSSRIRLATPAHRRSKELER